MSRWITRTVTALTLTVAAAGLVTPAMADTTETKPNDSAWIVPLTAEVEATVTAVVKPLDSAW
jgi:hypothetical protein